MMGYDDLSLLHEFDKGYLRKELFDEGAAASSPPPRFPYAELHQSVPFPAECSHSDSNQPRVSGQPVDVYCLNLKQEVQRHAQPLVVGGSIGFSYVSAFRPPSSSFQASKTIGQDLFTNM
mmetsp:Transcript_3781/g.9522  ORF Transcript_3781/g.9522 Transcript_3781/m.9522 type:complete len:120 (+) Transcript_3781:948-1307(+)